MAEQAQGICQTEIEQYAQEGGRTLIDLYFDVAAQPEVRRALISITNGVREKRHVYTRAYRRFRDTIVVMAKSQMRAMQISRLEGFLAMEILLYDKETRLGKVNALGCAMSIINALDKVLYRKVSQIIDLRVACVARDHAGFNVRVVMLT
ncbi:MAG: hypothetical protein QXS54_03670 [Candidatus Methanomethylicaceae archaeon]